MTLKYRFSRKAEADLEAILDFSHQRWGPDRTLAYLDDMQDRVIWLTRNPDAGRRRDALLAGIRSDPQGRHLLYYLADGEELVILRILHQSAEPPTEDEIAP